MAVTYMTEEGLQKLKEELRQLETVERPRVIAAIAEARDKGDLSENAEYDAAKEEQGVLESKIAHIKAKLMEARVLDTADINTDEVQILTKVRIRMVKNGAEKTYHDELEWFFIWNLLIDSAKDFDKFPEGKPGFQRSREMMKKYFPKWRKNRFLKQKPLKFRMRVKLNYKK